MIGGLTPNATPQVGARLRSCPISPAEDLDKISCAGKRIVWGLRCQREKENKNNQLNKAKLMLPSRSKTSGDAKVRAATWLRWLGQSLFVVTLAIRENQNISQPAKSPRGNHQLSPSLSSPARSWAGSAGGLWSGFKRNGGEGEASPLPSITPSHTEGIWGHLLPLACCKSSGRSHPTSRSGAKCVPTFISQETGKKELFSST